MTGAWLLVVVALGCAPTESGRARETLPTHTVRRIPAREGSRPSEHRGRSQPTGEEVSCMRGDAVACHAAALDAYEREGATADEDAARLFGRGCDAGYAPSCNGLGVLHSEGRGVEQDHDVAASLYRLACDAGVSTGCFHLSQALQQGRAVPSDQGEADRAEARYRCLRITHGDSCPPR